MVATVRKIARRAAGNSANKWESEMNKIIPAMFAIQLILSLSASAFGRQQPSEANAESRLCNMPELNKLGDGTLAAKICADTVPPSISFMESGLAVHSDRKTPDLSISGIYNPAVIGLGLGNRISFCPELSCVRGPTDGSIKSSFFDHQRASLLISGPSQLDGVAQEQLLAVIGTVATGRSTPWKPRHTYAAGENINRINHDNSGAVYRAVTAGISGTKPPPAERPSSLPFVVHDGGVTWEWINDPAIAVKANFYNEQTVKPGAASTWAQANNVELQPGVIPSFHVNTELDFGNNSGIDCGFANGNCFNLYMRSGGKNMLTGHLQVDGDPAVDRPYAAYFGIRIAGPKAAQIADIITESSGAVGIGICSSGVTTCSHSTASIKDKSSSPVGLQLDGNYSSFSIKSNGFSVDPHGFTRVSGLNMGTGTPSSARSPCNAGDLRFDAGFVYACVTKNTWKRAALSDW